MRPEYDFSKATRGKRCAKCGQPGADRLYAQRGKPTIIVCGKCTLLCAPVCDFCRGPGPVWDYRAADFSFLVPPGFRYRGVSHFTSTGGGWGACEQCHCLIEEESYEELARQTGTETQADLALALEFLRVFFKARLGPAERVR